MKYVCELRDGADFLKSRLLFVSREASKHPGPSDADPEVEVSGSAAPTAAERYRYEVRRFWLIIYRLAYYEINTSEKCKDIPSYLVNDS